eukprot:XP_011446016.1 PREDICTED: uncharacterized protein LOC105341281 isoform X2 [Crassostrea gigas]
MDGFEQHTTDFSFEGVNPRYHNQSYINGDRWSSTNTSEFPPINRPRLVKIVSFWLTLLLVGLICAIIYLAHIREPKTRYYISHGKLAILQEYSTALGNKESMEYKSLTASFCSEMDKSFRSSRLHTNTYRMCIVTNLRPGSVIVTFTLYFDATVDLSDTEVIKTINNSVQHIGSRNMLGNYPIDINGISITTTLTLYEQDPIPFLEPDSDFIIPPTTKQTTPSTAVTSTSTIPATVTTAISPADTTETKKTTTSSTETTKVTTVMTQPITKTTKSTTTMPMTTTAETTTYSHTEAITTLLTSTTEPKTTTTLPSTVTTKLTTTIPLTTTTEGTTSSHTSPTTTITSSLAPTVTTKPTTTIELPTSTQDTKATTFVPTTTTEATTSTNLPPSSTTKATTLTPFTSSTEAKTTTIMSLITTEATASLSPTTETKTTTTEAKTTTTFSPSTRTEQTTPTVTSEVTTTATGSPVVTTEEITVKNTTREATTSKDTTEATVTNTTSEDTTREVTTKATTASTTAAAATNTTREDITTALVTNTTNDVTTENTITMTTSEFTTGITLNTTTEYTTEPAVTNTTKEYTTKPIVSNTTNEFTTEPAVTNTTKEYTTKPTVSNTTNEFTTEPTFTITTREDTTVVNSSGDTTGTSSIATTVSPFTADVMFPSKNILASEDTTLECVITVTDQWEKVTINQETETDFVFLAEFYNNGSVFSQVTTEFLSVVFKQDNKTIETIIYIDLQNSSSCPSLLHFDCGIIMEDTFKSVITKTSILSITAPLHNITLDMANVYYSGERLELICRTITDFEYGDVALEVRSPNGLVFREPAPRTQYALTRNSDCSVNFEWKFKSGISLASSLNGSTVWCIASNRLYNTSVSTSQLITVLVSDVSFSQYYVPGSVGKQVMIECETTTLTSNIAKMAVYKTLNGTNETIASYSSGNNNNTNSRSDILVTFQGGMLTLTFFSLKCSDEGLYICVVKTGSSEVSTPLSLTLQPTVLAGSTAVSLSLNTDIVENYYRYTSEHSCTGEIGYPDAGFLSLSAIHPTSGETVVYNEEVVTDAMKVKDRLVGSDIYSYGVTLAKDFRILVKEDRKVQENCSTIHKVRFFLNVSREWSRGRFRCEIRTKEGRIPTSLQEEQFYVIPSDVCDAYNKTKQVFIDHEKNDNCNTYIQCGDEAPYGKKCSNPRYCVFIGKDYCDECVRAICTETPTTTARPVPTTEAAGGFSYLDCNSSSVSEGESASIGCHLNSSSFVSLNILKSEFTIASIQVDGSVVISPNYQGKLFAILDLPSLLLVVTINTVTCSDDGIYNVTLQLDSGNVTSTTFKVNMKVKPKNPTLSLNPSLVDGENSLSHSCTGNVGNPPGSLQIQIRRSADSNFTEYSTPRQIKSSSLESAGNCSYIKTLSFSIDLTTESWSNMTIRCVALNTVSVEDDDPVPSSILYTRTSISSEFCENKNKTYYDYHPMGCPFYVWCVTGRPYGQVCPADDLCMNPVLGDCERKK